MRRLFVNDFSGWTPMRVFWREAQPIVDWGHLGTRRFTEPFFEETIDLCVRNPADLLFRHQTPLESLGEIMAAQPVVRPTGFIFHMSRCGSTLISQMLAALPVNISISEATPIDTILRARFRDPKVTEEQQVQWLRWMAGALGWRRRPEERHLFLKFDCWHALFLPLIQRAFPDVPWIFLYREPLEVMASQARHRGAQMIPGVLEPGSMGWEAKAVAGMGLDEYGARVLARICEAALAQVQSGSGKLVDYRQLPNAVWPALMRHWGVEFLPEETERMMKAAELDAKNPVLPFEEDGRAKRERATTEIRALTERWLAGVYQKLEEQRLTSGFV